MAKGKAHNYINKRIIKIFIFISFTKHRLMCILIVNFFPTHLSRVQREGFKDLWVKKCLSIIVSNQAYKSIDPNSPYYTNFSPSVQR